MNILLTGGAGYIGSACLRWLARHGHNPTAFDNLSEGNRAAVPKDRLHAGDVLDFASVLQAMYEHDIEAVMHFAGFVSVPESVANPMGYWDNNVLGTKNVLDAMLAKGVGRILFSSTAATYSFDSKMPLDENSPQIPKVPYGTTKLAAEQMIKDYAKAYDLEYSILRYFNAAGADPDGEYGEDRRKESHLVPLLFHTALGKRDVFRIFGTDWRTRDGSCIRDFIHTDDLALAHQLALERGGQEVYTCGSGTGTTVLEVLHACESAIGRSISVEVVGRRKGDPEVLVASPQKLIDDLGWWPRYPRIEQIVETAWRWHSSHPDGYW